MNRPAALRTSLRILLAWGMLSVPALLFTRTIVTGTLPGVQLAVNQLQGDYLARLNMDEGAGTDRITMECTARREIKLGNARSIAQNAKFRCGQTDAVHALVPLVVFLVPLLAWPVRHRRELLYRGFAVVLVIPPLACLPTAILLDGLVTSSIESGRAEAHGQLFAMTRPFVFSELGGRWLIALLAAALCILLSTWTAARRESSQSGPQVS